MPARDEVIITPYRDGPLVHDRITPRLYTEMVGAMGDAFAERDRISIPLLFLVPSSSSTPDLRRRRLIGLVTSKDTGYESTLRIEGQEEEDGSTNPNCQRGSSAARSDGKAAHKAIQLLDVYPCSRQH